MDNFTSITGQPFELKVCEERNLGHRAKFFAVSKDGQTDFSNPFGLSVDRDDNIYIADAGNGRVQVFHNSGYYLRTIGTSGRDKGEMFCPRDVAVSELGRVDSTTPEAPNTISKSNCSDPISAPGQMSEPWGVAVTPEGYIVVADNQNNRLQVFTFDGDFIRVIEGEGELMLNGPSGNLLINKCTAHWGIGCASAPPPQPSAE
eukprot:sb/3470572/